MREVDSDHDNLISLRDFLILFRKRQKGELLSQSFTDIVNIFESSIDVQEVGVVDAAKFFESKAKLVNIHSMIESEVRKEADLNKQKKIEKMKRKDSFQVSPLIERLYVQFHLESITHNTISVFKTALYINYNIF